jgi:glycosyltransferase involved in cell wall biosynthesis
MIELSIVIPVYNEEGGLPELHGQITASLGKLALAQYEIIFIDDGSRDRSFSVIRELAAADDHIRAVRFRINYGKAAALYTAFRLAQGEFLVTMDADLQDDPEEIGPLLAKLKEGYDLVSGWKKKRHDPLEKRLPSKLYNLVTSWVAGVRLHDFNCGLKAYRRDVYQTLNFHGEMHRMLPVLAHWNRFRVTEIPVQHHPRKFGRTKYGFDRYYKGFLDLVTITFLQRYTKRPLHIFGLVGILIGLAGMGILGYFGVQWIITRELHVRPLLILGGGAILMGIQIISLGLLGEMIAFNAAKHDYQSSDKINLGIDR